MTKLRRMIWRVFSQLSGLGKPAKPRDISPTSNSERLRVLRQAHSRHWEIRPNTESELAFGSGLGASHDGTTIRVTEQPANRIRISVRGIR
jgi:hypothetical protein